MFTPKPTRARRLLATVLVASAGAGWCAPAFAQAFAPSLAPSPSTDPAIDRDRADRRVPEPTLGGQSEPVIERAQPQVAAIAADAGQAMILNALAYEGSSLPAKVLDAAVAKFVGQPLTQENVKAIADVISKAYASSDIAYYSVAVPPQVPEEGVLRVVITEGRLVEHTVADPTPSTPVKLIAGHVRRMQGGPLRKSALERHLALIRDIPGQTVTARIRQLNTAGDLVLELEVKRKQLEIELTLDNAGIINVIDGPLLQTTVAFNGGLREGDTTQFSANVPFAPERYQFYSLSHETPIGATGLSIAAAAARQITRTRDGIDGEAILGSISARYRLVRSGNRNATLSASFDLVSSSNNFFDVVFGDFETRVVRLGGSLSDGNEKQAFAVSGTFSQGLDVLGARPFEGFSDDTFSKINLNAVYAKSIKKELILRVNTRGQYSEDLLPITERFVLGGRGKGLAFLPGVELADQGLGASIELSQPVKLKSPLLRQVVLFAFADGAIGRSLERPEFNIPDDSFGLASAGGGMRVNLFGRYSASTEIAIPIESPSGLVNRAPLFLVNLTAGL